MGKLSHTLAGACPERTGISRKKDRSPYIEAPVSSWLSSRDWLADSCVVGAVVLAVAQRQGRVSTGPLPTRLTDLADTATRLRCSAECLQDS